jgi:hypothetical protein
MEQTKEEQGVLGTLVFIGLALALMGSLSGCLIPSVLGVKEYTNGETNVKFITGADFGFSLNGTDTVENRRGIQPSGGYAKARAVKVTD